MKLSQLFTKTRKEAPADEVAKNAQLLIRGGFIHKEMAGVYSYLPLGLRVLNKINDVIREELEKLGAQELVMTALQNPEIWKKTDRWEQDVWFKTALAAGGEVGLGWTQEEAITRIASQYVSSYRDLPFYAYQIQTKFRNEERAKSGIMRGREFLMKDLYSFHADQKDLDRFYDLAIVAYKNIFVRLGIGEKTYLTFASGGAFSKYSHEFQTISDAGEDTIYVSTENGIAVNKEVLNDEVLADLGLKREELVEKKSIEVGNIFKLGTRFSDALDLSYVNETGEKKPVVMGGYGMGPSRLMGTIVEALSDEKGIVWPESVAPFSAHLIQLTTNNQQPITATAERLYDELTKAGITVLYDDRDTSAGEKFADADLLGIPTRIVVSEKSLAAGGVEVKKRTEKESHIVSMSDVFKMMSH
ncbi:MAG: aminoacyl--tRNA ligase-related protein [Patescibacteria group bacterium]